MLIQNAREKWLRLILRSREMIPELKTQIERNNIHLCELHFKSECVNVCKYTTFTYSRLVCSWILMTCWKSNQTYVQTSNTVVNHNGVFQKINSFTSEYSIAPRRKDLVCGSVPTENLPTKSDEDPTRQRRTLVQTGTTPPQEMPSTSPDLPKEVQCMDLRDIVEQASETFST